MATETPTSATATIRGCCLFCGAAGDKALVAKDRNRELTSAQFVYERCRSCGSFFIEEPPADLPDYYRGDYFGFGPDGEAGWRASNYLLEFERYRLDLLKRYVAPGRLIEIGAGAGAFAWSAQQSGFEVSAIEMDERCCRYLEDRLGVHAVHSDDAAKVLPTLASAKVVALWHVLEHLPNPAEVIDAAVDRLEPGGILAIGVPNMDSLQFRLLRSRWAHLDAPRHLVLIPVSALVERGRQLGLECIELTTDDPFGRHCNMFGWQKALTRRPAAAPSRYSEYSAAIVRRLVKPLERRHLNGSTVLVLFRRSC